MEHKYLVIEMNGDALKEYRVIGRYTTPKDAYSVRDIFRDENPTGSYVVAVVLNDYVI